MMVKQTVVDSRELLTDRIKIRIRTFGVSLYGSVLRGTPEGDEIIIR